MKPRIGLLRMLTSSFAFLLAIYSFVQTSLYVWLGNIIKEATNFLPIQGIVPLILLTLAIALVFLVTIFSSEAYPKLFYLISLLLYLPAVLSHSGLNWLNIINVELSTELPYNITLIIGLAIISGYLLLLAFNRAEETYTELVTRGATEEQASKAAWIKIKYSTFLITLSGLLAFLIFPLSTLLAPNLKNILTIIPISHIVVGFLVALLISLSALFYLISSKE
ncbi:hypothetical protein AKJ61_04280 [candidate division MSBL1 archaeon SCGC-AAA259B11]|uniref:Uncharacterized protein n=1 Tax=candidate division MSBL1 archaeon SCGC-AAA259B11 TaxID=1698260 RepID=A0A133U3J4_9EURY|nr:hypothetical protein AKJ61_04280 [candidate division MSBL1 archaeon SCGC-AAA259B11]